MDVTKCNAVDTETIYMVLIHAHSRTHDSLFSFKWNLTTHSFPKSTFPTLSNQTLPFFKIMNLEICEVIGRSSFPTHRNVVDIIYTYNLENISRSIPVFKHKPLSFPTRVDTVQPFFYIRT